MKLSGFKAAAAAAGMRYRDRLDLGLIVADQPVTAAGVFTRNLVKAAPVLWSEDQLRSGFARAILVNSGQANACSGAEGLFLAARSAQAVAKALECKEDEVLLASTGVIGQQLNLPALDAAVPSLIANLSDENLDQVAQAMMTTDTRPKMAERYGLISGKPFKVVGLAKGAGMICPDMATMLCFILTNVAVTPEYLKGILVKGAAQTFNAITVDGDTSTNDCILALAGGWAGNELLRDENSLGSREFEKSFVAVLADLAKMIVADGEGATKVVTISVSGALNPDQARAAAKTVANSPLVKTAIFGQDANWGRIMAALGRSGAVFDPNRVNIDLDETPLVREGRAAPEVEAADEVMRRMEFIIKIDLRAGPAQAEVLTCDLSLDYIKINASYRS